MLKKLPKFSTGIVNVKNMSVPSLKSRLRINVIIVILPLFFLAGVGYYFFQKSTNASDYAIENVVSEIIPVTQLKDKIQQSVVPFNLFLDTFELDDKNKFLQLSSDIKQSLINRIELEHEHEYEYAHEDHTLTNDLYRSAYLNWRNVHRIAVKIFKVRQNSMRPIPRPLLQDFYRYMIETTLMLDQLHLAMQNRVKIYFQKAKELEVEAIVIISTVLLLVYIITLIIIIYLNRSILNPVMVLEKWALNFSRGHKYHPIELHSYREFEYIAATYNKFSQIIKDDDKVLEQLSQKDNLTQLYNKRYFIRRLVDEHHRHQRYNTHYCLMLIDVDHLDSVSQNYGDTVCELTLIKIARLLEEAIRPTDTLAYYESDRFIVILPEVEVHGANITAERIINSISETVFNINEFKFGITVSIGFSMAQKNLSLSGVLECTDYSLQQAKRAGRNQVQYCDTISALPQKFQAKYLRITDFNIT